MKNFGIILGVVGAAVILFALHMDITAPGSRTVNLGLMDTRQNFLILGGILFAAGAIVAAISFRSNNNGAEHGGYRIIAAAPGAADEGGSEALIKRAFIMMEDGDWTRADELLDAALNFDPENARIYVGKLCAALKINSESQLAAAETPSYTEQNDWKRALQFADEAYRATLAGYVKTREDRLKKAAEQAAEQEREDRYEQALAGKNSIKTVESSDGLRRAANEYAKYSEMFKSLSGFRDADALAAECDRLAAEWREKAIEKEERFRKRALKIAFVVGIVVLLVKFWLMPPMEYASAEKQLADGKYYEAWWAFEELGDYKDARAKAKEAKYAYAEEQLAAGEYQEAWKAWEKFRELGDYKDAKAKAEEAKSKAEEAKSKAYAYAYAYAERLLAAGEYSSAWLAFNELGDYKDAEAKAKEAFNRALWKR